MLKYGSDKPDLRNPLVITDVTDIFEHVDLKAFSGMQVRIIAVHNVGEESRSFFEGMTDYAIQDCKAKGLAWLRILEDESLQGPIAKYIPEEARKEMLARTNSKAGDALFFIAEIPGLVDTLAGQIRCELGKRLNLIDENVFHFCWIVDFPMYELDERGKLTFCHNPFSMPQGGLEALTTQSPLDILAYQYDMCAMELNYLLVLFATMIFPSCKRLSKLQATPKRIFKSVSLRYIKHFNMGAPPHAGIAPGIDRMLMLLSDAENIREVIAFPMNSKAQDFIDARTLCCF